jgi:hypothetical protein
MGGGLLSMLLGGGMGAGAGAGGGAASGIMSILQMAIGFLADGGNATSGNPYIVGEQGPELFVPGQSGSVISHKKTHSIWDFLSPLMALIHGGKGLFSKLSPLAAIFGGFKAEGGGVNHGNAYIVGEKGPELFMPQSSGTIIPSFSLMKTPSDNNPLNSVGQAFDGFRAMGGDVTPGHSYVVGENHPEVFISKAARSASPSSSAPNGGARQTTVNFHVHGVSDSDSFRRSQSQIYAGLHAQMELARSRG